MTQGKVAGPYEPMYPEIMDELRKINSYTARWLYSDLICSFGVSEVWDTPGEWIRGKVFATKAQISKATGIGKGGLKRYWKMLVDAGLVEDMEDGSIEIIYYKKKVYISISPQEIIERFGSLEDQIDVIQNKQTDHDGNQTENDPQTEDHCSKSRESQDKGGENCEDDHPQTEDDHPHASHPTSINGPKEETLSLSGIVDQYNEDIHEDRISTQKRAREVAIAKKLEQDGFTLEEIAYAATWTIENAKEKPYGFGLVPYTIGRAMAARQEELKKAKRRKEAQALHDKEEKRHANEERLRRHVDLRKESLADDERRKLRDGAMDELRSEGVPESFITDFLIERKENALMMKEYEDEEMQAEVG